MELIVSGPGWAPPSPSSPFSAGASAAILIGQAMKSEYRLTISLIFQGDV
jgi:hypothetical protein